MHSSAMEDTRAGGGQGFNKPQRRALQEPSLHLYVANCGPAVGLSFSVIQEAFASFGEVAGIRAAGDSGTRVIVSFRKVEDAVAAKEAWSGQPCDLLQGRIMYMQHSVPRPFPVVQNQHIAMPTSSEIGIPGLMMYPDFLSIEEEEVRRYLRDLDSSFAFISFSRKPETQFGSWRAAYSCWELELLAAVDALPWQTLAKRRVQHYGYEFLYKSRNVNLSQKLGNIPIFVGPVMQKISSLPELTQAEELSVPLDQLTVNEYPRGVGLSPHVDTHSAFEGSIISLSLAGHCVMEFRRYPILSDGESSRDEEAEGSCASSAPTMPTKLVSKMRMERKALFLSQRSLLVLSGEARYAWHHYIPHHKFDQVAGQTIPRSLRRVSFTFRKVRSGSCQCKFTKDCDSQVSDLSGFPLLSSAEKIKCLAAEKLVDDFDDKLTEREAGKALTQEEGQEDKCHQRSQLAEKTDTDQRASLNLVSSPSRLVSEIEQNRSLREISSERISLCTPEIEKLYVHKVYDAIAPHFSATRFAKWPKVSSFLDSLAPGSLVADCGCGNGKYLGFNPKCLFIGCDISPRLVAICAQRGHESLVADALHLPHRTGFYDASISIAVLHHLSNDHRRIRAIEELVRVVCAGGKVLITVWAREQEDEALVKKWAPLSTKYMEEWVSNQDCKHGQKQDLSFTLDRIKEGYSCNDSNLDNERRLSNSKKDGISRISFTAFPVIEEQQGSTQVKSRGDASEEQQEYFVPWHLPYHRAEVNGASAAALASGFARKDEKKGAVVYDRYYHVFAEGELERLAAGIQGADIIDRFYDKSNWCIILRKR